MNNKGFTLVELVVVIALIAAVAGIFTINMTNILQSVREGEETRLMSELELAADAYINVNLGGFSGSCINIQTSELIAAGFLKQSDGVSYSSSVRVCKDENGVLRFS